MHENWVLRLAAALLGAALLLLPRLVLAQGSTVYQNGNAVPNHIAKFVTQGRIADVGGILGDGNGIGVAPFAITDNNNLGLCSNNAATTGPFKSFCLGHDSQGNALLKIDGGGQFHISLNGTSYAYPAPNDPNLPHPNIVDYGGDPGGVTDSGPAFAAACAANPGQKIYVTAGTYLWTTAQTFTTPCHFTGSGWNERNNGAQFNIPRLGTWIKLTNTAITPITFSGQAAAGTGGLSWIAFEQAHAAPGVGWSPTVYPPVVVLDGVGQNLLEHVYFWGIYDAVKAATANTNGRITLNSLRGTVFHNVFTGTQIQDLLHFSDWHFWTYWASADPGLKNYLNWSIANGSSMITLYRSDGLAADRIFGLGFNTGLLLSSDAYGFSSNTSIQNFYCDVCKYGVHIVPGTFSGGNLATGSIGFLQVSAGDPNVPGGMIPGSISYWDESSGTSFHIDRLRSQGSGKGAVYLTNGSGSANVDIDSLNVEGYNQDNNNSAALFIAPTGTGLSRIDLSNAILGVIGDNHGGPLAVANGNIITEVAQAWTPGIGASGGTTAPAYTSQQGRYVIHGNTVTASGSIAYSALGGSPTGTTSITGFPAKLLATTVLPSGTGYINSMSGITLSGTRSNLTLTVPPASAVPQLLENGSGQPTQQVPVSVFTGPITLGFQFTMQLF